MLTERIDAWIQRLMSEVGQVILDRVAFEPWILEDPDLAGSLLLGSHCVLTGAQGSSVV
jgi:hypothetical protein